MNELIERNHMDYSSGRVQFMLGLTALPVLVFCLNFFTIPEDSLFLFPNLAINTLASTLVGLVFFEIGNRYGNRLQAVAGVWAALLWLLAPGGGGSWFEHPDVLTNQIVIIAILPVYIHLRLLLLEERRYYWWCWLTLAISLFCGAHAFIFSASGIVLSAFFLPKRYPSNPIFAEPAMQQRKFHYTFLLISLAVLLAACFYLPWTSEKIGITTGWGFTNLTSPETAAKIASIACAILFLIRILSGKLFPGPFLFCLFWLLALLMPFPVIFAEVNFHSEILIAIPLIYLLVTAGLPLFDVLSKRHSLILALSGSIFLGILCYSWGVDLINKLTNLNLVLIKSRILSSEMSKRSGHLVNMPAEISTINKKYLAFFKAITKTSSPDSNNTYLRWNDATGKIEEINYSGQSHLTLRASDIELTNPKHSLPENNWIEVNQTYYKPWTEKKPSYLNIYAGANRTKSKFVQKEDCLQLFLSSVKINPHQANNVKIKLAFPFDNSSDIYWIWKGSNIRNICSVPLKLEDAKNLVLNLKDCPQWQMNDSIEKIGLAISPGNRSLAIEKIEL